MRDFFLLSQIYNLVLEPSISPFPASQDTMQVLLNEWTNHHSRLSGKDKREGKVIPDLSQFSSSSSLILEA